MDREIKTWLFDIQKAIEEIEEFLPQGQEFLRITKMISKLNVQLKEVWK